MNERGKKREESLNHRQCVQQHSHILRRSMSLFWGPEPRDTVFFFHVWDGTYHIPVYCWSLNRRLITGIRVVTFAPPTQLTGAGVPFNFRVVLHLRWIACSIKLVRNRIRRFTVFRPSCWRSHLPRKCRKLEMIGGIVVPQC